MRRIFVGIPVLALVLLLGCSKSSSSSTSSQPAATGGGAATLPIQVDGKANAFNAFFTAYFPSQFQAHPGDTLQFKLVDTGEPHTVTFGKLIDTAIAAQTKANNPDPSFEVPELEKLPVLVPTDIAADPKSDVNQTAANPCFLDSGDPPANTACPKRSGLEFSGTQSFFNSGWLTPDSTYDLKLSSNIQPGTYTFICLLHRAGMVGQLTVVDKSKSIPTADQVKQAGAQELDKTAKALQPAADQLTKATPAQAFAGNLTEAVLNAGVAAFGPKEISIPVGGTVNWTVLGPHTISFNAAEDAKTIRTKGADGTFHANKKSVTPANSAGQPAPPPGGGHLPPNLVPFVVDGGSWDGSGFKSSGLIVSLPPDIFGYKLTFTKAGTYQFKCLIHDNMEGTVKVGQ